LGSAVVPPPWEGGVADPLDISSSPAKFGRSRSDSSSVIKEIRLKNLRPCVSL